VPDSLAGGVKAGSVEAVMVVSWESVVERGWLWEERSSPSAECCRSSAGGNGAAADADAVGREAAPEDGGAKVGAEASVAESGEAIGRWEAREEVASTGDCTAKSPPTGARAVVTALALVSVASPPASSVLNDAGSATRA
jgi:hypothetical protein